MTATQIDGARPIRAGEELPLERLGPYLVERLEAPADAPLEVTQFPGGHSNLTYLVRLGDREYVLRRPPFGSKVKTAHDMAREVRILSRLSPVYPRAPRPVVFCEDEGVIGAKFYLMERVRGVVLRREPSPGVALDPTTARRLGESFVDTLAELHAIDHHEVGLGDFGRPEGYVERQVSGWSKRYADSRTDDVPDVERVASWLAEHRPTSPAPTILHNDYKYDNLVLDAADLPRIIGILDWEMATIGDPLMDLGTALSYWVQADDPQELRMFRFGPTDVAGSLTRREVAERYAARTGRDLSGIDFYYRFGLFKNAVVAQQIYYRWVQGYTKDERFGLLLHAVRLLSGQAAVGL